MNKKIFLTGSTGFLGSHIARKFINNGNILLLSYRDKSNFSLCADYKEKVKWVNTSSKEWIYKVECFNPEILINAAWQGVGVESRNNWFEQIENIFFQQELLDLSKRINIQQFVGFGSQAEYGYLNNPAKETDPTNTTSAYGAAKLAALQITKSFCEIHSINWIWLRLFSFFGEGESDKWLIPFVIKKIINELPLELTSGEQQVAYLHVNYLTEIISKIITKAGMSSGVYNISGNELFSVKDLVTKIRDMVNPEYTLTFGGIPCRKNQSPLIIGDMSKLKAEIEIPDFNDFEERLKNVILYYINQSESL